RRAAAQGREAGATQLSAPRFSPGAGTGFMRYQRHLAAALTAALLAVVPLGGAVAQDCGCPNPDVSANGRIAGALGGGLFAGLIAAVLGIKHVSEASAQPVMGPAGGLGPGAAPMVSVSTGALSTAPDSADDASPLPAT